MTLKDLWERQDKNEIYEIIGDYLNTSAEYRLKNNFEDYLEELVVCSRCDEINKDDDMVYHIWDIGNVEEKICQSCRNDEDI